MESYIDLLQYPYPFPLRHKRMPPAERAAQFAPFAALTGFDEQLDEEARLTDCRPAVDNETALLINDGLRLLLAAEAPVRVRLTFFVSDTHKQGGAEIVKEGDVRRVDAVARELIFTDKTAVSLDDILALAIL